MPKRCKKHGKVLSGSGITGMLLLLLLCGCGAKEYEFQTGFEMQEEADKAGQDERKENDNAAEAQGDVGTSEIFNDDDGMDARGSCYVHICGAVIRPGVYCVAEGSRLYEVILAAGGLEADAADEAINQAQEVTDGMQIYIPTRKEVLSSEESMPGAYQPASGNTGYSAAVSDARIDLNTAGVQELCTLPGIGETRAQAIIAYREEHGAFKSTEELMNVTGIKAGVYEKIKELIKV